MEPIEKLIAENNYEKAIEECVNNNFYNIAFLLSKITKINTFNNQIESNITDLPLFHKKEKSGEVDDTKRVLLYCSWTTSENLCNTWKKMSKNNDLRWDNIKIVSSEPADYYCIINRPPPNAKFDKKKTILFRMEPNMENDHRQWEDWANPNTEEFLFVGSHNLYLNNFEWHLSKNYQELSTENIVKDDSLSNTLTTILSDKYLDKGHIKRVDFVKFLEKKGIQVDVYGGNKFLWKNYKGSLPYHKKDDSLLSYKYSFNCENHSIKNYCTEKLIDGILSETLTFYSGCYNVKDYIDERAFVYLELSNFEKDYQTIKKAIEENWWEQRLPYIKEAKNKILNDLQFFARLHKIINSV